MIKKKKLSSLEKLLLGLEKPSQKTTYVNLKQGARCPKCRQGRLDYNGFLQLVCPKCGFTGGGEGPCS